MSLVLVDSDQKGIASVVLSRVDKLNAFSHALMDELSQALERVHVRCVSHQVRVVIVRSASVKAFSAGADLAERLKMDVPQVEQTLLKQRELVDRLAAMPAPTIAVIEGVAFGLGLELALACDLRVAAPDAQLGLTETKLGIIPGAGGTQRLTRVVGEALAKELIFLGRRISGLEAASYGLVHGSAPAPLEVARDWALQMAQSAPIALAAAKQAIDGGCAKNLKDALDWERACYERTLQSQDRIEGLKAFAEKRSPRYKGI